MLVLAQATHECHVVSAEANSVAGLAGVVGGAVIVRLRRFGIHFCLYEGIRAANVANVVVAVV